MMDGWGWHGMVRGPGLVFGCFMFLLAVAAVALVVWLLVRLLHSTSSRSAVTPGVSQPQIAQTTDPVLETLRRRLAEGAITAQEFDELRQKLGV